MVIWKYNLGRLTDLMKRSTTLALPGVHKIVHCELIGDDVFIWVQRYEEPAVGGERVLSFQIFGTGWKMPEGIDHNIHVRTFRVGLSIWHLMKEEVA